VESPQSVGGNQAAWIHNMFAVLPEYPIKLAVGWSATDFDVNGQPAIIYTLDENEAMIQASQQGFSPTKELFDILKPLF
jgi:hypothetical protein